MSDETLRFVYTRSTDFLDMPHYVPHPVLKVTARQIVIEDRHHSDRPLTLDRAELEREGSVYHRRAMERYYLHQEPDDPAERTRRWRRLRMLQEQASFQAARCLVWQVTAEGIAWRARYYQRGSHIHDLLHERDQAIVAMLGPEPTPGQIITRFAESPNTDEDRELGERLARGEDAEAIGAEWLAPPRGREEPS